MTSSSGPLTTLFGDNSTIWNNNFGGNIMKKNLFSRGFLMVAAVLFYGALTYLECSEKYSQQKSICEVQGDGDHEVAQSR